LPGHAQRLAPRCDACCVLRWGESSAPFAATPCLEESLGSSGRRRVVGCGDRVAGLGSVCWWSVCHWRPAQSHVSRSCASSSDRPPFPIPFISLTHRLSRSLAPCFLFPLPSWSRAIRHSSIHPPIPPLHSPPSPSPTVGTLALTTAFSFPSTPPRFKLVCLATPLAYSSAFNSSSPFTLPDVSAKRLTTTPSLPACRAHALVVVLDIVPSNPLRRLTIT
jgi:hypothetical protein